MVISGCADGVVAVSNPKSGLVVRVISDHEGAPITDLQSSANTLMVCVLDTPYNLRIFSLLIFNVLQLVFCKTKFLMLKFTCTIILYSELLLYNVIIMHIFV